MRLNKLVSIVGICAVSVVPLSAMAAKNIVNAESGMCLDATSVGGMVQQSKCNPALKAQGWNIEGNRIVNAHWTKECLDVYVVKEYPFLNTVQTSKCEGWKKAQEWKVGEKSGEIQNNYTSQCLAAPGPRDLGPVKALPCRGKSVFQKWQVRDVK